MMTPGRNLRADERQFAGRASTENKRLPLPRKS
jgi:hypothetical protein